MDSKRRVTYATLVLLISTSYQCTARWINDTDMTDITREVKSALNVARNTSRAPGKLRSFSVLNFISCFPYDVIIHIIYNHYNRAVSQGPRRKN